MAESTEEALPQCREQGGLTRTSNPNFRSASSVNEKRGDHSAVTNV
jgi:hypothetical protein